MKNHIRKIIAKIESQSDNSDIRKEISNSLEEKGISKMRLTQFRGNHRQPKITELDAIFSVFKEHLPDLEMTDLYEIEEKVGKTEMTEG